MPRVHAHKSGRHNTKAGRIDSQSLIHKRRPVRFSPSVETMISLAINAQLQERNLPEIPKDCVTGHFAVEHAKAAGLFVVARDRLSGRPKARCR